MTALNAPAAGPKVKVFRICRLLSCQSMRRPLNWVSCNSSSVSKKFGINRNPSSRTGYDLFNDPILGRPEGNKSSCVAYLANSHPQTDWIKILHRRMELRKSQSALARELGVDAKTLLGWKAEMPHQGKSGIITALVGA